MNISGGTGNDLFTSFTKIGKEIDDIFSTIPILSPQSNKTRLSQSTENQLKGSSGEFFDDSQYKPSITKSDLFSSEDRENSFSTTISENKFPIYKYKDHDDQIFQTQRTVLSELTKQISSTPTAKYRHFLDHQNVTKNISSTPPKHAHFQQEQLSHYQSLLNNESRIISNDIIEKERELCMKKGDEAKLMRKQILDLNDRIQVTVEERNKIFFKLEAAIREISSQGQVKQGLSQKIAELNQKMLDNDFEINQLKSQVDKLSTQLEAAHNTHEKLLDQLDQSHAQVRSFGDERRNMVHWMEKANDETNAVRHKYELLQKLHSHCNTVSSNNQAERNVMVTKIENLNKQMVKSDQEKNLLLQNLNKVYKLIEKLEGKATEKIKHLSQEVKQLQDSNIVYKDTIQEKDAMLSMNKNAIRDLEAKLGEYDFEINDIKKGVQSHERENHDAIMTKNKKIKMLSLKIKQLQNRIKTQTSQVEICTETNENLESKVKELQLANSTNLQEIASKIAKMDDLEGILQSKNKQLSEYAETIKEMRSTIQHLTTQTNTIQQDKQSKSTRLNDVLIQLNEATKKLASQEEHIVQLQDLLSKQSMDNSTHIDQYDAKIRSQEKKIAKLKDNLTKLFSVKQEGDAEIENLRNTVETMSHQFDTTQNQLTQQSGELQEGLLSRISEQSQEIEQHKQQIEKLTFEYETKMYDTELELNEMRERYDEMRYSLDTECSKRDDIREQHSDLLQTVEKYRQRHTKLKQKFQERLSEQNQIIDNCVDRTAAEQQIKQLRFYYHTLYSPLFSSILALKSYITPGKMPDFGSPVVVNHGDDENTQRHVDHCCMVLGKLKDKLDRESSINSDNILELRKEVDKISAEYEQQIQAQQIYFGEEISQLQKSLKSFTSSYLDSPSCIDNDVLGEFDRLKEAEYNRSKLGIDYERATLEALSFEEKLKHAKRNILEYRTDSQAVGVLEHKLNLHEQELIRSKEKANKQRSRLRNTID